MRFASTLFALALLPPVAGFSQTAPHDPPADVGSRVRIAAPVFGTKPQLGTVVSLTSDTVVLRLGAKTPNHSVAVREITSLEVARGKHSQKAKGALWGTVIGTGTGAILGYALWKEPKCEPTGFFSCFWTIGPTSRRGNTTVSAVAGGIVGVLVGTIVGSRQRDTWVPASLAAR